MRLLNTLIKRYRCNKGKHSWDYYINGNRLIKEDDGYAIGDVPMRYCKYCMRLEEKLTEEWTLSE